MPSRFARWTLAEKVCRFLSRRPHPPGPPLPLGRGGRGTRKSDGTTPSPPLPRGRGGLGGEVCAEKKAAFWGEVRAETFSARVWLVADRAVQRRVGAVILDGAGHRGVVRGLEVVEAAV